jgi:hypothetical protein
MEPTTLLFLGYLEQLEETTQYYETRDQCLVPHHLWRGWIEDQGSEDVLLVKITQGERTSILCVGGFTKESDSIVFLPRRCFLEFDTTIPTSIEVVKVMPPSATKITLQPLDNELYHCDIATAVSKVLSEWQVLTVGTTLTVPCEELGGYMVDIFVRAIEPENIVLLRGDVPLELAEPLETVPEWTPQQSAQIPNETVHPNSPQEPFSEEGFSFLPNMPQEQNKQKFTPFSGTGYRLGN